MHDRSLATSQKSPISGLRLTSPLLRFTWGAGDVASIAALQSEQPPEPSVFDSVPVRGL
jgi:hypothetical protein